MRHRLTAFLSAIALTLATAVIGVFVGAGTAHAATSATFGPRVITGIPKSQNPALQMVVPMATIETPSVPAGANVYVYSSLTASKATYDNLVDNEVRCSGAGKQDVVMGENIEPSTGAPDHQSPTIVTRFLVTATSAGVISCTLNLRTNSTLSSVSQETVQGELRFASYSIPGDTSGAAIEQLLPVGNLRLDSTVVAPVLDTDISTGYSKVDVAADMEFHWCAVSGQCNDHNYSTGHFALTVTTSGGSNCSSAPVAQTDEYVQLGVNHAAIPLYTTVNIQPGCTHLHAQVTSSYVSGNVGLVGGAATGLTDSTGHTGDKPNHTSAMSHMFALPRTS